MPNTNVYGLVRVWIADWKIVTQSVPPLLLPTDHLDLEGADRFALPFRLYLKFDDDRPTYLT